MRPGWESGLRGRLYAIGRRAVPLRWRRALRRRVETERLLGLHKPAVELPPLPPDPGPTRAERADVLVLPVIPWTYRRQRPQQLAEALGRAGRRTFYASLAGSGEPDEPIGLAPRVTLLPVPGVRREDLADRRLDPRAVERAFAGLSSARDRFGLRDAAVLVQSPFWAPLALALRERLGWRVVYDCLDAHAAFESNRAGIFEEAERALAAAADLVVATSEPLRARLAEWNPSARLLPNACDFEMFGALPAAEPDARRLVVGYVGAVDDWFDIDLLADLATLRPAWRFEIVGAIEDVAFAPPQHANVTFHGERPHRDMPGFRARFDVEIIPFRITPLTDATDPVKLYEAAAAGRPVVATPMRSLEPLARKGLVRLASGADAFAQAIAEAAGAAGRERSALRAFARENTWDVRAAALDRWLTELAVAASGGAPRSESR